MDGPAISLAPGLEAWLSCGRPRKSFRRSRSGTHKRSAPAAVCGQYGEFAAVNPVRTNGALRWWRHSPDMIERVFFDHVSPDGVGPDQRALDAGYDWIAVGENIAAGSTTPRDVVDG